MLTDIDELKLYFGKDYFIKDGVVMKQPTIGQIIDFGEERYFRMAQTLTAIPSDMKSVLWDSGIDYEEISDFELFIMLTRNMNREDTFLLLGDIDLSEFDVCLNKSNNQTILYNYSTGVIIDELTYILMSKYICKLHGFKKKIEKSGNAFTKKILINEDRDKIARNKSKPYKSTLLPIISSMLVMPGFKYKKNELSEVGMYEFMDNVSRICAIKVSDSLTMGLRMGTVDKDKISKDDLNWMRDLSK